MSGGFLLSSLGFPFVRMGGAEYDPYESDDSQQESKGLKPIHHAGGIKVKRLFRTAWRLGFEWGKRYLPVFFEAKAMRSFILKPRQEVTTSDEVPVELPRIPPTHRRHITSLYKLVEWKVMRIRLPGEHFFALGSYFEVPKKDGWERTIIDLRPLNAISKTPPRVGLADIKQLLLDILRLGASGKGIYMSTGDFLNYYHQLPIPKRAQNLFAVRCRKLIFFMKVCPMGASSMCFLAQLATWSLVLSRAPNDRDDLGVDGRDFGIELPPGIIYLRNDQGLLNAQYDNILVCTRTRFMADRWVKRIKGNAEHFKAHWGDNETLCEPKRIAVHLGVEIDGTNIPRWRHDAKKAAKWEKWFAKPRLFTPRWVAKIVGISVWDATIRLLPLFQIDYVIDAIRYVHMNYTVRRKKDWYQRIDIPPQILAILRGHMLLILRNEWHEEPIPEKTTNEWVAASDASEFGTGYVILHGQRGSPHHDADFNGRPGSALPQELVGVHIYILELYGAFRCIQAVAQMNQGKPTSLHLLMDNTAAKAAIHKKYSSNKYALEIIKRIHFLCQRNNIVLTISWIASDDNPADEPSRRLSCSGPSWAAKCRKALDFAAGKWSYAYTGNTRHEKLHDVPSDAGTFPVDTSSEDEEDVDGDDTDITDAVYPKPTWLSDDDESDFASDDEEVEERLLKELDECFPEGSDPASMQMGFISLLRILDGERHSSE